MPFYRCTISGEDGSAVAEEITVMIEEMERDGEPCWYGTISATHLTMLMAGQHYRLELEDGRVGTFHVKRNTFAGGTDRAIAINGEGALGRPGD